jgi:hypothetical protein
VIQKITQGITNMKMSYSPEVSLGNILQIIAIIGSVFAAYTALKATDYELAQRVGIQEVQISTSIQRDLQLSLDIKELAVQMKDLDLKLTRLMITNAEIHGAFTNGIKPK